MTQDSGTESLLYPVLAPELWWLHQSKVICKAYGRGQDWQLEDRTLIGHCLVGQQRYGKLKGNHKEPMRGFMRQVITAGPSEASSVEWVNELLPFILAHEGRQMHRNLPSGLPGPDAWVLLSLN